jgi:SWI/SNF-related matrix-associated actin-dependent regulator of chromatin subfamily A-like protein 1
MSQPLKLKDFQKEDVLRIRDADYNALNANAPGTGKTIETLACIAIDRVKLTPAVIICPSSVVDNWKKEAKKWLRGTSVYVIKDKSTRLPKVKKEIYIISWALIVDRAKDLLRIRPQFIVADEAHYAKNAEATRSQVLYGLALRCPHRLMLTGTPLVNNADEFKNIKELFPGGDPLIVRRLLEEVCPEIPAKQRALLPIELPKSFRKDYDRAQAEFSAWLEEQMHLRFEDKEAEAAHRRALAAEALVKVGYLRRIVGKAKTNAAVDWAARAVRLGEAVVIFAEHQDVIKRMSESMTKQRLRHVILDGSTPRKKRQAVVDEFQEGKVPIFIGSKAASTGITLTRSRNLLFCERFWTSAEEDQAEDRIRRIGQKYATKIWALHAVDSIDDRIARIIDRKRALMDKHIGLEDIEATPEETVLSIIQSWSRNAEAPYHDGSVTGLGLGKSLPALPRPNKTLQIIFAGNRWNRNSIKSWGDMNGYLIKSVKDEGPIKRATIRHAKEFKKGSFTTFSVSKEIRIVVGVRAKKAKKARGRMYKSNTRSKRRA